MLYTAVVRGACKIGTGGERAINANITEPVVGHKPCYFMAYCGVWCLGKQAWVGGGGRLGELYQHFKCSTCQTRTNLNILLLHGILWWLVAVGMRAKRNNILNAAHVETRQF